VRVKHPVRLSAADWRRIYEMAAYLREWNEDGPIKATPPTARDCFLVLRKIGANGMAAAARGVAAVQPRRRSSR
jgi:hypothetical protein